MSDFTTSARERVIVLGLGNLLRGDEGLGIYALERLQEKYIFPEDVLLVDGGTLGLDLLSYLEGAKLVLVLDAALTDGPPGTIWRASNNEVPAFFGMRTSPHEIALPDLLALMRLRETGPRELIVLGMQPATIALGWGLSEAVSAHLDELANAAADTLRKWGIEVKRRVAKQS
ncbi:MAG TPA: HyaD/HybD family hydrogenase maturation endopeptidase, partial [Ktedonobacteraceae bacterium]